MSKKFSVAPFNPIRHQYVAEDKACEDELSKLKEEQEQCMIWLKSTYRLMVTLRDFNQVLSRAILGKMAGMKHTFDP